VQQAFALRPGEAAARLRDDPDPERLLREVRQPRHLREGRDAEDALRRLQGARARLLPLPSPAYPEALLRLPDPAPVLAVRGDPGVLKGPCVALVGARAATAYGREVALRLAGGVAAAGVVVVSGLARGIDAAVHEAALAAGGVTVAVQACGPDRVYPADHRRLAERIARQGAVISELPPGMPPLRAHFPLRNRLISGLSHVVVVVEARVRSGSLVTARHALDQGVEVMAVPGPITAPTSEGTNRLLRDGAAPALEPDDVLRAAGLAPAPAPAEQALRRPDSPDPPLLVTLREAPCTRDVLARRLGWEPGRLAAALLELELAGRVVEDRDGRLVVRKD
jgi:DNA processing protein